MAHVSMIVNQPVSLFKGQAVSHVMNSISEAFSSFKANRDARRVEKILAGLDPRLVRDIMPQ